MAPASDLVAVEAFRRGEVRPPGSVVVLPARICVPLVVRRLVHLRRSVAGDGIVPTLDRLHPVLPVPLGLQAGRRRLDQREQSRQGRDEKAIVVDALLADHFAAIIMALHMPLYGALEGKRNHAAPPDPLGRLAGGVETAGVGAAAEAIGALHGHADPLGGPSGDAEIGQRLDIFALPGGRPAVGAVAQVDRPEGKRIVRRGGKGRGPLVGRGPGAANRILVHLRG